MENLREQLTRSDLLTIRGGAIEESCTNQQSFLVCYNCALSGMDPSTPEWTIMESLAFRECGGGY